MKGRQRNCNKQRQARFELEDLILLGEYDFSFLKKASPFGEGSWTPLLQHLHLQLGWLHQCADTFFYLWELLQDLIDLDLIKFQTQKFRFLENIKGYFRQDPQNYPKLCIWYDLAPKARAYTQQAWLRSQNLNDILPTQSPKWNYLYEIFHKC